MNKESVFRRLMTSRRFWTAFLALGAIVAAQLGMPQEKANALSVAIGGLVAVLIGAYTQNPE